MIMALYIVVVFYTQGISFGAYQNVKKYSGKNGLYIVWGKGILGKVVFYRPEIADINIS